MMEVTGPQHYFVYKHHYSMEDKSLLSSSVSLQRSRQENGKKMDLLIFFTVIRGVERKVGCEMKCEGV